MKFFTAGFSLLELLITLSIIAIIAAVAYPAYQQHLSTARRSEGQVALLELAQKMERYYAEHNSFIGASLESVGSATTSGDNPKEAYYQLAVSNTTATSFEIIATPTAAQMNQDKRCGILAINELGQKGILKNGQSFEAAPSCW